MTVYSFPAAKRQHSTLGAQPWVVGEAGWPGWGLGARVERGEETDCVPGAGRGRETKLGQERGGGRRQPWVILGVGREAEEACLKQVRKRGVRHPLCNDNMSWKRANLRR